MQLERLSGALARVTVDWFNFCRDVCAQYFLDHPIVTGRPGTVVEIDESKFGKRKYRCLPAALLSFSINLPIFQYFACIFSILQRAPYMMYILNSPRFQYFISIYGQNSVKILINPYTWRH